jgi:S1-C subfamily serine protease
MNDLITLSNGLAAAVRQTSRSVFGVKARPRLGSTGVHWRQGLVVTSDHTVRTDDDIALTRPDGRIVSATIAGRDPTIDIAVLRVDAGDVPLAQVGDSSAVQVGHIVLAIGDGPRASWGVVSSMGAEGSGAGGGLFDLDLTLYPGFSGGPLVDVQGRVVGVNTSGVSRSQHLAIPAAAVDRLLDGLLRRGHIPRPYLGVSTQPVRLPETMRERFNLEQATAVIVVAVQPGSPAAQSGLVIGDVVVSLGGASITDPMELRRVLQPDRVGEAIVASVIRGGEARDLEVVVGERPRRA